MEISVMKLKLKHDSAQVIRPLGWALCDIAVGSVDMFFPACCRTNGIRQD